MERKEYSSVRAVGASRSITKELYSLFSQNFVIKLSEIWVWALGFEIRDSEKPIPGQKGTESRIHMFLGLLDPDPDALVRGMDPDPAPDLDPCIIM
jgi:hypothetical protein